MTTDASTNPKLSKAILYYRRNLKANGRSELTISNYMSKLEFLIELLGDVRVERISVNSLNAALLEIESGYKYGHKRSGNSVNQFRSIYRTFFSWCFDTGFNRRNPASNIKFAKQNKKQTCAITIDEINNLLTTISLSKSSLSYRDKALFALYAFTGLRRNEVLGLKISNLQLDKYFLFAPQTKTAEGNKRFIPKRLLIILSDYLDWRVKNKMTSHSQWLFPGRNEHHPLVSRRVNEIFAQWKKKAKLRDELTIHSFRAGFATRLHHVTKDPVLVSKAIGHKKLSTTQHYISINEDQIRDALEKAFG